jgi:hypothetical protein
MFLLLGFWQRNQNKLNVKNILILAFLFLLLFLSHAFVFALTCSLLFLLVVFSFSAESLKEKKTGKVLSGYVRKSIILLVVAVPSIILWKIYIDAVMAIDSGVQAATYSFPQLFKELFRIRQLVGFHHSRESVAYRSYFILICILIIYKIVSLIKIAREKEQNVFRFGLGLLSKKSNQWLGICLFLLLLYFFIPNKISAGSLTHRIGIIFFYILIAWLAFKSFPRKLQVIVLIPMMGFYIYQKIWHHNPYKDLNKEIEQIEEIGQKIPENATYYPILSSSNWIHPHFLCYLGVDKPLINLNAPQLAGQFPLIWNDEEFPVGYFGNQRIWRWNFNEYKGEFPQELAIAEYAVLFNEHYFAQLEGTEKITSVLSIFYTPIDTSSNGTVVLYKFTAGEKIEQRLPELKALPEEQLAPWRDDAKKKMLRFDDYLRLVAMNRMLKEGE